MIAKTEPEVVVELIDNEKLGRGEILEINYETGEALISVEWANGSKGQYWACELEFIFDNKNEFCTKFSRTNK